MKRKFQFTVLVAVTAILFTSCATPAEEAKPLDLAKIRVEIQAMEDAFSAAEKAKDAAGVVVYYSDDAISYGRNEEPLSGKAAIKDRIAQRFAKDTTGNTNVYKVVDLFGEGNMLVEIGSWTMNNKAGALADKGHYMSVFQKRDGKYVCIRDMSVTSTPAK